MRGLLLTSFGLFSAGASPNFGVILDCGSSKTAVHVFTWTTDADLTELTDAPILAEPGLSSFAGNLSAVQPYLLSLVARAKELVPSSAWHITSLRALATGGVRTLPAVQQVSLINAARHTLLSDAVPFAVSDSDVTVLGGSLEALFGWLALNYVASRQATPPTPALPR